MRVVKWLVFVCILGVSMSVASGQSTPLSPGGAPQVLIKTAQHGIPSAILEWDAPRLFEIEEFEIKRGAPRYNLQGRAPVPFNTIFINWQSTDPHADPSEFQVMVRTRAEGGTWPAWWKVTEGGCCLECKPVVMYMTFFTAGQDQIHNDFEVQVKSPAGVVITSMQLWFIDTHDHTADLGATDPLREHFEIGIPVVGLAGVPPQPTIISRSAWWGGLPPGEITAPRRRADRRDLAITITHAIIHHTFTHSPPDLAAAKASVRSIWTWHAQSPGNNWGDIGYNFLVDPFGNIFQGTFNTNLSATDVWGIHAGVANSRSVGIGLLGRFHPPYPPATVPTPAALQSTEALLAWRFAQRNLDPLGKALIATRLWNDPSPVYRNIYRISGHRDVSATACPGDTLQALLPAMRTNVHNLMVGVVEGDLNKDGEVSISDVVLCLRMAIGLPVTIEGETYYPPYPQWLLDRADMNADGEVSISDVVLILRRAIGLG